MGPMNLLSGAPLWAAWTTLALAALVILLAGSRLSKAADTIADRTGLGEAVVGAVLLGAVTSLPGLVVSLGAAMSDYPRLALSNALGGIAAQTVFLVIADITYRNANLEHAAASLQNIMSGTVLVTLLSLIALAPFSPDVTLFGIHPATPLLFLLYGLGVRFIMDAKTEPMWRPHETRETRIDEPDEEQAQASGRQLAVQTAALALVVALAGYAICAAGVSITEKTELSESFVGALFTAVATSLPELVTTLAAIRQRALTLAVGGILGGNVFDTLFVAVSDIGYRGGSIYHSAGDGQIFMIGVAIMLTGLVILSLLRREKHGTANIGFLTLLVGLFYIGAIATLVRLP